MYAYEVHMYTRRDGRRVHEYSAMASGPRAAKMQCVEEAAEEGKITRLQKAALINKIKFGLDHPSVDTGLWAFRVEVGRIEGA